MTASRPLGSAAATFAAAAAVLFAGCFGSVADVRHRHHVLDGQNGMGGAVAPPARAPVSSMRPGSVAVRDFHINAVYDRAQLVRRLSDHEVEFVRGEVWAARLGRMLADAVAQSLMQRHVFASVYRSLGEASETYTLTAEVTSIEWDTRDHGHSAHFGWMMQLVEAGTGRVVGQHTVDFAQQFATGQKDVRAAVSALDALLQKATFESIEALLASL